MKLSAEQDYIVGSIKGQLLAATIGAVIMFFIWLLGFNRFPPSLLPEPGWIGFGLLVILPLCLWLRFATWPLRGVLQLSLTPEEKVQFTRFVSRYPHVSRTLFWWFCFAVIPTVLLRILPQPIAPIVAAIVAFCCGVTSSLELWRYYKRVEAYYKCLPADLLQEVLEEARRRERGPSVAIWAIVTLVSQGYRLWRDSQTPDIFLPFSSPPTPLWQEWGLYGLMFIFPLGIVSELLFSSLVRRWTKSRPRIFEASKV